MVACCFACCIEGDHRTGFPSFFRVFPYAFIIDENDRSINEVYLKRALCFSKKYLFKTVIILNISYRS